MFFVRKKTQSRWQFRSCAHTNNNEHPHELTTRDVCKEALKEETRKWAKLVALGSLFVAAKVNECRNTNPFLIKHFKATQIDIEVQKILMFEIALLNAQL